MMRIGILEAGAPPAALCERFGSYGKMFRKLLGPAFAYSDFNAQQAELPPRADACDAYLITGSASGVYDGDRWIAELQTFVRDICGQRPLIGICFGHQIMAEAFGGRVVKSPNGWGVGLHTYEIQRRTAWMDAARSIVVPVSHQDQVVEPPVDGQVLAGSPFTPYGLLAYPQRRAISMQCHPEFEPEFLGALIALRGQTVFGAAVAESAVESLQQPDDRTRLARWLREFLRPAEAPGGTICQ